jgi:hypothetical protein
VLASVKSFLNGGRESKENKIIFLMNYSLRLSSSIRDGCLMVKQNGEQMQSSCRETNKQNKQTKQTNKTKQTNNELLPSTNINIICKAALQRKKLFGNSC